MTRAAATLLPGPSTLRDTTRSRRFLTGGLFALLTIMPFHAFLSVYLGHLLGHETLFQAWKEVLTLCLAVGASIYLRRSRSFKAWISRPVVLIALFFIAVALLVTALVHPNTTAYSTELKLILNQYFYF